MRSMALTGIAFRSTAAAEPVSDWPPNCASRRPLSSTRVRVSPMLWMDTPLKPKVEPPTPAASCVLPCTTASRCSRSTVDVAPVRSMSSRLSTCTGREASASMRRIAEPVISMRWVSCASAAPAPRARAAAMARRVGVNGMATSSGVWVDGSPKSRSVTVGHTRACRQAPFRPRDAAHGDVGPAPHRTAV